MNQTDSGVKKVHNLRQFFIITTSLIIGAGIIAAAVYWKDAQKVQPPKDLTPEEKEMVWTPPNNPAFNQALTDVEREDASDMLETDTDPRPSLWSAIQEPSTIAQYELTVDWEVRPIELEAEALPVTDVARMYKVGVVTNGVLKNAPLYLIYDYGMAMDYPIGLYVFDPVPVKVTDWIDSVARLPKTLTSEDGTIHLSQARALSSAMIDIEEMSGYGTQPIRPFSFPGLENIPGNTLYTYQGCFFARTPADLVVEYVVDVPFIAKKNQGTYATPDITFTRVDGKQVSGDYEIYDQVSYGCGSLCSPLKVVHRSDTEFVKTGSTADGSDLFVLRDTNDPRYLELYNQKNTRAFIDTSDGTYRPLDENKYSYESFLETAPLLYWKDPFGRWVEFVNTEFIILAEKCKPVIYLYPEEEMDVHVEVAPNIGFTKTIPDYNDGWDVTAHPDGTVIDRNTGKDYEYLYWSGLVDGYPLITEGWVVAQSDIPAFFEHYLPLYGLKGREITDFTEYWEGDLSEAPYYAITFVDQAIVDELSPLSIDKEPDTLLRILMTAQPLARPIKLAPPQIPEIHERTGFTVVEWGGTILR